MVHGEIKEDICAICDKAFARKVELNEHINAVHKGGNLRAHVKVLNHKIKNEK